MIIAVVLSIALAAAEEFQFVNIAEGYTAATEMAGVDAAYRMFTVPWARATCPTIPRTDKVRVVGTLPRLTVGRWFPYGRLVITALDVSGNVMPRIPIDIEVEEVRPAVLALGPDMIAGEKVLPIHEGKFRFRVTTICEEEPVSVVFQARAVNP